MLLSIGDCIASERRPWPVELAAAWAGEARVGSDDATARGLRSAANDWAATAFDEAGLFATDLLRATAAVDDDGTLCMTGDAAVPDARSADAWRVG